jgi:hypothetical protein
MGLRQGRPRGGVPPRQRGGRVGRHGEQRENASRPVCSADGAVRPAPGNRPARRPPDAGRRCRRRRPPPEAPSPRRRSFPGRDADLQNQVRQEGRGVGRMARPHLQVREGGAQPCERVRTSDCLCTKKQPPAACPNSPPPATRMASRAGHSEAR